MIKESHQGIEGKRYWKLIKKNDPDDGNWYSHFVSDKEIAENKSYGGTPENFAKYASKAHKTMLGIDVELVPIPIIINQGKVEIEFRFSKQYENLVNAYLFRIETEEKKRN